MNEKSSSPAGIAVDILIKVGFLILLVTWCLQIILPFFHVLLWGIILALALSPLYLSINNRLGNKPKLAASILIICGILVILVPAWLFFESALNGAKSLLYHFENGTLTIPPPTERVAELPVLGDEIYEIWAEASVNLKQFITKYNAQISGAAQAVASGFLGLGGTILQFILSLIIAGVLLATSGTRELAERIFRKVAGSKGGEFADIITKTVRNVTKGVLGVAVIQAVLVGIGFLFAGVPFAGLWTVVVLILAMLQLPAILVIVPVAIWLFSVHSTLFAVLWTVYLILAGLSDNLLKPMLLGKGAPVPMMVIFLGVVGGFIFSGFIGLFTGAIILSLGYKLFITWLYKDSPVEASAAE